MGSDLQNTEVCAFIIIIFFIFVLILSLVDHKAKKDNDLIECFKSVNYEYEKMLVCKELM